ncbi:sporulation histidine kinase inhibitor Sda [Peribacillus simplex]|uniref:sporulation histidine kinase inhibitor Sda n=1 Tax=Peribacillus simplex TaxID=1478 RepID=UPI003D03C119
MQFLYGQIYSTTENTSRTDKVRGKERIESSKKVLKGGIILLQKLSNELLINPYLKAKKLEIDPSFISLLTNEINKRFRSDVI